MNRLKQSILYILYLYLCPDSVIVYGNGLVEAANMQTVSGYLGELVTFTNPN